MWGIGKICLYLQLGRVLILDSLYWTQTIAVLETEYIKHNKTFQIPQKNT